MPVTRWTFRDVWGTGPTPHTWTFTINPNEGGSPNVTKEYATSANTGPRQGTVIQEGPMGLPSISFSGVILVQEHYEALEYWYSKRLLLELTDDIGREFQGSFASFSPQRVYKPYNPWYHTYSADFNVSAYRNASGLVVYGRFLS